MPSVAKSYGSYRELGTGMEMELVWSNDETMVELNIASANGRTHNIKMSSLELSELKNFLHENIE